MTAGAFQGAQRLRSELLSDLQAGGKAVEQWLERTVDDKGYSAYGERCGFHPAFTNLVAGLAGDLRTDAAKTFLSRLLQALPLAADTLDATRRWFGRAWHAESIGLERTFEGTPAHPPALAVIRLVQDSCGEAVPARAWRAARGALGNVDGLPPDTADHVPVILAMCWDLDQVPGAAMDVVSAWTRAISRIALRATGWTDELGGELEGLTIAMHEEAQQSADATTPEALRRTFMERFETLQAASARAVELNARFKQGRARATEAYQRWAELACNELIDAAAGSKAA